MAKKPRRVAVMLDLRWALKRHTEVFSGMQRFAQAHTWESIVDEFADRTLSEQRGAVPYDGIVARANKSLAKMARRLDVPLVNVWFTSPARKELPGVFPDYAAAARMRAEHLLARGLRSFAVLARVDRGAKIEAAAFRETVQDAGCQCIFETLPLDPVGNYTIWQKSRARVNAWMNRWQPPIGVFVHADDVGRWVAQMCLQRGWRIPQDVALISGANEETYCLHPRPSLSSIERGFDRVGYEAARLLEQLMDERASGRNRSAASAPEHIFVAPQALVVRESTDFFAVDDPLVAAALEFISAHSHRRIGQNDVSRAVSAETRTLQSRFRKVLDRPIVAVIRQVRIERAKRELVQSNLSLRQIARDVGFGESARMNDVFRRELGVSPGEYRKQRQLNHGR
ncbi:MAG: substrate-binding domain-containing protein [Planctomycetales bacterium]|nr:substrate-binding domain-containing protein [Planctomycetales bacterium]